MNIAVVADIHACEPYDYRARALLEAAERARADVLLLGGDLTDSGTVAEARLLAEDLRGATIPIGAVLGNHDHDRNEHIGIRATLKAAGMHFLDEGPLLVHDTALVGVKGFGGGFGRRTIAAFGEEIIKKFTGESIQEALRLGALLDAVTAPKIVVLLHYAPIPQTLDGEPLELFPFLGTSHLMDTIDRFPVSVVFHGHAHHGSFAGRTAKGIPVYNVARAILRGSEREFYLYEL